MNNQYKAELLAHAKRRALHQEAQDWRLAQRERKLQKWDEGAPSFRRWMDRTLSRMRYRNGTVVETLGNFLGKLIASQPK